MINSNKIKNYVKQILNILAKKAYLVFLFLIVFYFILGGILIYKYSVLAQKTEIYTEEKKQNTIKKNTYQKILEHWSTQKIKFNEIDKIIYPDPFIEKSQPTEANENLLPDLPAVTPAEINKDISADVSAIASAEAKKGAEEGTKEKPTAESFFGKINTLFDYYVLHGKNFLPISERAKIWEQEGLGEIEEYHGFYNQNINLLEQLTR